MWYPPGGAIVILAGSDENLQAPCATLRSAARGDAVAETNMLICVPGKVFRPWIAVSSLVSPIRLDHSSSRPSV